MIRLEATPPTLRPPGSTGAEHLEPLDRALKELVQDQWIDDFIERLSYAIDDVVREKH